MYDSHTGSPITNHIPFCEVLAPLDKSRRSIGTRFTYVLKKNCTAPKMINPLIQGE